jgi:hypothetical protein
LNRIFLLIAASSTEEKNWSSSSSKWCTLWLSTKVFWKEKEKKVRLLKLSVPATTHLLTNYCNLIAKQIKQIQTWYAISGGFIFILKRYQNDEVCKGWSSRNTMNSIGMVRMTSHQENCVHTGLLWMLSEQNTQIIKSLTCIYWGLSNLVSHLHSKFPPLGSTSFLWV